MIIHTNDNLFGLGEDFHIRQVEGGLRVNRTTIPADDPAEAFEKIKAAAAKGETYVDLDAEPEAEEPPKKAPAKRASTKKAESSTGTTK